MKWHNDGAISEKTWGEWTLVFPPAVREQILVVFINSQNDSNRHAIHAKGALAQLHAPASQFCLSRTKAGNDWATCSRSGRVADLVKQWTKFNQVIVSLFSLSIVIFLFWINKVLAFLIFWGRLSMVSRLIIHRSWRAKRLSSPWSVVSTFKSRRVGLFSDEEKRKKEGKKERKKEKSISNCFWAHFNGSVRPSVDRRNKSKGNDSRWVLYHSGIVSTYMYGSRGNWIRCLSPLFWFSVVLFLFPWGLPVSDERLPAISLLMNWTLFHPSPLSLRRAETQTHRKKENVLRNVTNDRGGLTLRHLSCWQFVFTYLFLVSQLTHRSGICMSRQLVGSFFNKKLCTAIT